MRVVHIVPGARRSVILTEAAADFRSTRELAQAVARRVPQPEGDAALNHVRTVRACRDLRRRRLLHKTPYGWRTTSDGMACIAEVEAGP